MPGKTALVIGSSSGIGRGLCARLEKRYEVVKSSSKRSAMASLFLDLTDRGTISPFVIELKEALSGQAGIDLLILNSGISYPTSILHLDEAKLDDIFAVNTINQLVLLRELIPLMREGGSIVSINSKSSLMQLPFLGVYAATKSASLAVFNALKHELRPYKIRVKSIVLGNTKTEMWTRNIENTPAIVAGQPAYERQITNAMQAAKEKYADAMTIDNACAAICRVAASRSQRSVVYLGTDTLQSKVMKFLLPTVFIDYLIARKYGF